MNVLLRFLFVFCLSLFVGCEDENNTNEEEVFEVDRLYGLWFNDSTVTIEDGDTSLVLKDITLEEFGHYWVLFSENEKKSYLRSTDLNDCYNGVTRSITYEKIDDKNFKSVELREDGSTIEYYFNFKNDYDGMYYHTSNNLDDTYTYNNHLTKIENRTFEPICP